MMEVQIHDFIFTSDLESDQLRASTADKGAPGIIWIGNCVRALAVMNALWRRAWPDMHCRTVTIQLLFTVCVCACVRVIMSVHTGRHVHGQVHYIRGRNTFQ